MVKESGKVWDHDRLGVGSRRLDDCWSGGRPVGLDMVDRRRACDRRSIGWNIVGSRDLWSRGCSVRIVWIDTSCNLESRGRDVPLTRIVGDYVSYCGREAVTYLVDGCYCGHEVYLKEVVCSRYLSWG